MKKNLRTELGKVRGLGSAHKGTEHFWVQNLTSWINIPLLIFFIILMISLAGEDYSTIHARLSHPVILVFMVLTVFSNLYHMKLEMQVVIEDYIPHKIIRMFFLILNISYCCLIGSLIIFALLKIALGV
ncbi:succinate dehydrogenase, hydrophobic membrane anchor protein [Bartonella bacilliformis str. Heidi Mejia]|uniref:Succinate dehydrogenase hydrophobic membrane anchor subunit n=2 Tax=Bartonella bacilliformis TaxID=774 RepID=A1UR24_BARBK|nr:succinate dehydrogenase, hydrophobic membrane anchor protein [Bartonella bacilliformis]ABM45589.1 succinate dehydrogenase, hydrophobic membrane anchor protein [Bartonella bacilliformis KC583]AMG85321.1 succinate dehydrogenase, hydrophobic membrane anchor protein [Bartonella bacilliformis]EKS45985.1 succinate dehydrogenase hydrophobic membrane anchor protein [Bartonella bacilliformis INS]EYS88776.1 succinate dehydrogenase, hydrophobic membrane anchor protein [Bartonella bacilliformis San Pedr